MTVLRPADLAARWRCSERHVRGLVRRGDLRSFRVGGKLIRIPIDAVEEFEKCYLNSGSCDTAAPSMPPGKKTAQSNEKRFVPNIVTFAKMGREEKPDSQGPDDLPAANATAARPAADEGRGYSIFGGLHNAACPCLRYFGHDDWCPHGLLSLTWSRVDFEGKTIDLHDPARARTHKGRPTVPMNRTAAAALSEAREGALTPYVIEWNGQAVKSIKRSLAAAGRRCGLPWVTAHVFRHSAASWMAEAGVPMFEIAQFLGHSDSRTTEKTYARLSPDFLRGAAEALEIGTVRDAKEGKVV